MSSAPASSITNNEKNTNTYVAIMAGGVGSRFWPSSRERRPKQFLDILGVGKSLLRLTFERFEKLVPTAQIFILTNAAYAAQVQAQLPELEANQILLEPSRNNTAPCVAYLAYKLRTLNSAANLVIAPSDHVILEENTFLETIKTALDFTQKNDALLTLGITPTRADTGYGYINYATDSPVADRVFPVRQFTEKPNSATAEQFVASGNYLWNAGIFVWRAESIIRAFAHHEPSLSQLFEAGEAHYNCNTEQEFIDEHYPKSKNISIDYAILERAENVFTIPSAFGWSDLGTWASLFAELPKDEAGNVISAESVLLYDVRDCLVRVPANKLVVLKGLENFMVIDDDDVLLIYPKNNEQEIKNVTKEVQNRTGARFL